MYPSGDPAINFSFTAGFDTTADWANLLRESKAPMSGDPTAGVSLDSNRWIRGY
jgi:hypothetical protein